MDTAHGAMSSQLIRSRSDPVVAKEFKNAMGIATGVTLLSSRHVDYISLPSAFDTKSDRGAGLPGRARGRRRLVYPRNLPR